ncbi:MAG TPA: hypothetical protein PKL04_01175 [Methanofastidiosum sp.]|nr:hypothetical protein [Methanofastidiosum sp.]
MLDKIKKIICYIFSEDFLTLIFMGILALVVASLYISLLTYFFGLKWAIIIIVAIKIFDSLVKRK